MIVLDTDDDGDLVGPFPLELQHQPPLVIQSHRVLMGPVTPQLLESKRPEAVEVSFVCRGSDLLHAFAKRLDNPGLVAAVKAGIGLQSVKTLISEYRVHGRIVQQQQAVVNYQITKSCDYDIDTWPPVE